MSLFRENRYSKNAFKLTYKIDQQLQPIFDEYIKQGYSIREISHLILLTVFELELDNVIEHTTYQPGEFSSCLEEAKVAHSNALLFRTIIGLIVGLILGGFLYAI